MSDEPYVNWEVAPEGCNAVFYDISSPLVDGVPVVPYQYEKWDDDGYVWDWGGSWNRHARQGICVDRARIFRSKEEIVSAKRKNTEGYVNVYGRSKTPEGTRVVEPIDMYQVHAYIRENLEIKKGSRGFDYGPYIQITLAGEVISEIEL